MKDNMYRIHGDNGELFCMCEERGEDYILMGKNTSLTLNSLVRKAALHCSDGRVERYAGLNGSDYKTDRELTR